MYHLTELTAALVPSCASILAEEWSNITEERLHQVVNAGHDESGFPCTLIMVRDQQPDEVLAHCRITKVLNYSNSAYIESIVVAKHRRGRGLGGQLLKLSEEFVKARGISLMFLTASITTLYMNHGYRFVEPQVVTLGSGMLGSTSPPHYTVSLPGWEHVFDRYGFPTVYDLIKEDTKDTQEVLADVVEEQLQNGYQRLSSLVLNLRTRSIKFYDTLMPELEVDDGIEGRYSWLAKSL